MTYHWTQRLGKVNFPLSSSTLSLVGILLCLLGGLAPVALATDVSASRVQYKLLHHVSYVHPSDHIRNGQLYLPDSSGPHPAILLMHGGGWAHGSDHNAGVSFLAPRLAARGWVVFNINYRLVRQGGEFPKDVEDAKNALAWMILHAKQYQINTQAIIPVGLSAGAHLALMAAYTIKAHQFPATQYPHVPLHVKAAVGFYTPTDSSFVKLLPHNSWAYKILTRYAGAWVKLHPRHGLMRASPVFYARDGVPTLLIQGLADRLVPAFQATEMAAALKKNAVPAQVVMIPNIGHAFMSFPDKSRAVGFSALLKFLHQQFPSGRKPVAAAAAVQ